MKKELYKPIFDENGNLDHYQVFDRKTGEFLGARSPDFQETCKEYIASMKDNPLYKESMDEFLVEERETETSARLKKIEERLEDVPVSEYLNIKQATQYLSVSVSTIRRKIKEGKLPDRKVAGKFQFRKVELDAYRESLKRIVSPTDTAEKVLGRKRKVDNEKIARNLGLGGRRKK